MFGNRAKISAEELAYMKEQLDNDRGFFENVNAKSKLIEADFDELEKSRQLEESSLKQLNDNANNVVEFSKDSMDAISALNDSFTECVKAAADNLTSLERQLPHSMRIHVRLSKTISILQLRLRACQRHRTGLRSMWTAVRI